jgi:glutaredoxin 3
MRHEGRRRGQNPASMDPLTMTAQVEIYTTPYCGYCRMAKQLLTRKNVAYTEIDVSGDAALRQKMVERADGRTTVPQIFVGGTHVGGCDDLYELNDAGNLDKLLAGQAV